jgi:hypothetical protein
MPHGRGRSRRGAGASRPSPAPSCLPCLLRGWKAEQAPVVPSGGGLVQGVRRLSAGAAEPVVVGSDGEHEHAGGAALDQLDVGVQQRQQWPPPAPGVRTGRSGSSRSRSAAVRRRRATGMPAARNSLATSVAAPGWPPPFSTSSRIAPREALTAPKRPTGGSSASPRRSAAISRAASGSRSTNAGQPSHAGGTGRLGRTRISMLSPARPIPHTMRIASNVPSLSSSWRLSAISSVSRTVLRTSIRLDGAVNLSTSACMNCCWRSMRPSRRWGRPGRARTRVPGRRWPRDSLAPCAGRLRVDHAHPRVIAQAHTADSSTTSRKPARSIST